jgi:hypothetical protein
VLLHQLEQWRGTDPAGEATAIDLVSMPSRPEGGRREKAAGCRPQGRLQVWRKGLPGGAGHLEMSGDCRREVSGDCWREVISAEWPAGEGSSHGRQGGRRYFPGGAALLEANPWTGEASRGRRRDRSSREAAGG